MDRFNNYLKLDDLPTLNIHGSVLTALRLHESSSVKLQRYELSDQ